MAKNVQHARRSEKIESESFPRFPYKCRAQPVLQHVSQTKETCPTPPFPLSSDKRIAQVILVVKNFGQGSIGCKPPVNYNGPAIA